jgi:hypothetical protein
MAKQAIRKSKSAADDLTVINSNIEDLARMQGESLTIGGDVLRFINKGKK